MNLGDLMLMLAAHLGRGKGDRLPTPEERGRMQGLISLENQLTGSPLTPYMRARQPEQALEISDAVRRRPY